MMELFNTTDRVRKVPKYRYAGVYTLKPKTAVDIEDFMAKFFEPWNRVGVVVRKKVGSTPNPAPIVESVNNTTVSMSENDGVKDPVRVNVAEKVEEPVASIEYSGDSAQMVNNEVPSVEISSDEDTQGDIENASEGAPVASIEVSSSSVEREYTDEELEVMGRDELKNIAKSLNVQPKDPRKKESIIEAIKSAGK